MEKEGSPSGTTMSCVGGLVLMRLLLLFPRPGYMTKLTKRNRTYYYQSGTGNSEANYE